MPQGASSIERILQRLDEYLAAGDPAAAQRHLTYWLEDATSRGDGALELPIRNELMGLFRREGKEKEAIAAAEAALARLDALGLRDRTAGATTLLNAATVLSAFSRAEDAISLFSEAQAIYERDLPPDDGRLGGLYNNMATALVGLARYRDADALYRRALTVMAALEENAPEMAITYLNMADALVAEQGALEAEEGVLSLLCEAQRILDAYEGRDARYAFVCEKCAPAFGYYGRFVYEAELRARAEGCHAGS